MISRLLTRHRIPYQKAVSCSKIWVFKALRSMVSRSLNHTRNHSGKELTEAQKAENKSISHRRVRIEHIICSVKRCRIVKETIRLWKDSVRDMVMAVCCGLHNFRLRLNPWPTYE